MKKILLIIFLLASITAKSQFPTSWFNSYLSAGELPTIVLNSITNTGGGWCSYLWTGNATSDGGSAITEKGFCWNTSGSPTTSSTKWILTSSGTGSYSFSIPSFSENTTYYGRAYAINSYGTAYSNEISFTTSTAATAYYSYSPSCNTNVAITANITSNGNSITTRELFYGISNYNENYLSAGAGNSSYTWNLTGLTANTTYKYYINITTNNCTALNQQGTFVTPNYTAPTVTTDYYNNVTYNSAYLYGSTTSQGGTYTTERGIVYSTSANPTLSDNVLYASVNQGAFYVQATGLTAGTTYHFRTFATNCIATSYGSDMSFTTTGGCVLATLTTNSVSNITSNSASSGGNITSDGGCSITARGICWSTSQNPTISDSHTSDGTGSGSFTSSITGLTCGTTYYVRAYATNSAGTAYGNEVSFSTELCTYIPTVSLNTINKYGDTYATFSGSVTDDGNSAVIERGFVYSITPNPTTSSNKIISGSGVGVFSANAYGLSSSTKYYVRAYAINNVGTAYSNELDFTTFESPTNVSISTSVPVNITTSSATLGGNISSDGGNIVTERGVVYGLSINPTTSNVKIQSGNGIGIYSVNVTGLTQGTTYHVRAYAINSNGTFYGADESFITSIDGATACNAGQTFPGGQSYPSTNTIVLGSGIGDVTLTFDAKAIPDFFLVEYNSITYNSGWRGSSSYDYGGKSRSAFKSALWGKIDPSQNPSFPTTYPNIILYPEDGYPRVNSVTGSISFTKSTSNPTTAIVKVYAPIIGTHWTYILSCPN